MSHVLSLKELNNTHYEGERQTHSHWPAIPLSDPTPQGERQKRRKPIP